MWRAFCLVAVAFMWVACSDGGDTQPGTDGSADMATNADGGSNDTGGVKADTGGGGKSDTGGGGKADTCLLYTSDAADE